VLQCRSVCIGQKHPPCQCCHNNHTSNIAHHCHTTVFVSFSARAFQKITFYKQPASKRGGLQDVSLASMLCSLQAAAGCAPTCPATCLRLPLIALWPQPVLLYTLSLLLPAAYCHFDHSCNGAQHVGSVHRPEKFSGNGRSRQQP
jgi:hypothetical protein